MKNTYVLWTVIALLMLVGCKSQFGKKEANRIVELRVRYIPWNMSTQAIWTEDDVRDDKVSYISSYCTTEKQVITQFAQCFTPQNFKHQPTIRGVPAYMLVDIMYSSGKTDKLIIGDSIFMEYEGSIYRVSESLRQWVETYIPPATFPEGRRDPGCTAAS